MIVVERDFIARWIKEMKRRQNSENRDYYTGYMSAMSTVEGMLAMAPEYDLDKLFTPEEMCEKMVLHGHGNPRFKLMEKIMYSPTEVEKILKGELPRGV